MLNAFCRVAPSVRLSLFAIRAAGVFFRAMDLKLLTSAVVQERLFLLAIRYLSNSREEVGIIGTKESSVITNLWKSHKSRFATR
jgi:hypothetical protein